MLLRVEIGSSLEEMAGPDIGSSIVLRPMLLSQFRADTQRLRD